MKTKRFWRSIFGTVLALALLLGAVPFTRNTARASSNPGTVNLNDSSEILALDEQAPKELDKYPENVYDVKKNQPFLLSEHNELALIVSNGAGERNEVTIFDTFDLDAKSRDEDGNSWVNGINTSYAQKTSSLSNSPYNGVYDIQSVGLDADGTGR